LRNIECITTSRPVVVRARMRCELVRSHGQAVRNLEDRKLLVDADNISGTYLAAYARGLPIRAGIGTGWRPHSAAGSEPPSLRKESPRWRGL